MSGADGALGTIDGALGIVGSGARFIRGVPPCPVVEIGGLILVVDS